MKISSVDEIDASAINKFDLAIVASGYESRARHLVEKYSISADIAICLGFENYDSNPTRVENDNILKRHNYKFSIFEGNDYDGVYAYIFSVIEKLNPNSKVFFDISCMTRAWVSSIVRAIFDSSLISLEVYFYYSVAQYYDKEDGYPANEFVGPMHGFSSLVLPDKPVSLIVGLGSDKGRSIGLKEYLDPQEVVAFCPIPGCDFRYDADILKNNDALLKGLDDEDIYNYPLKKPLESFKYLESVLIGTKDRCSVVLCSLGPKIFNLYCLLLSAHYGDVSVWRVTAGSLHPDKDCAASGEVISLKVVFDGGDSLF